MPFRHLAGHSHGSGESLLGHAQDLAVLADPTVWLIAGLLGLLSGETLGQQPGSPGGNPRDWLVAMGTATDWMCSLGSMQQRANGTTGKTQCATSEACEISPTQSQMWSLARAASVSIVISHGFVKNCVRPTHSQPVELVEQPRGGSGPSEAKA